MRCAFLVSVALFVLLLTLSVASAESIRIMPLGDSITLGYSVASTDNDYMIGYRQKLYLDLLGRGYDIEFVGSLLSGMLAQPSFDADHEGRAGWCADDCDPPYEGLTAHIYNFLAENPADVILLHIGTNDIGMDLQDPSAVGRLLDEIDRYSRDIIVVLARIIRRTDELPEVTTEYNDGVKALALDRMANGDRIMLVDMENALNYHDDMADPLHPNQTGYNKMADVWLDALVNIFSLANSEGITGTSSYLYGDFGPTGIWRYNGAPNNWSQITLTVP